MVKFIFAKNYIHLHIYKIIMKQFIRSFGFAIDGVFQMLKSERNFKIQLLALTSVVVAGFCFQITSTEWLVVLVISALVLTLEMVNSAIEKLCDLYSIEPNSKIKIIKDIAAGAVLIASIFAVIIAVVIFKKYFI